MTIVQPQEVLDALSFGAISSLQATALSSIVEEADEEAESLLGRPIVQATFTDTNLTLRRDSTILLRNTHVASVSELKIDGVVISAANFTVEPWGVTRVQQATVSSLTQKQAVECTYIGGLTGNDPATLAGKVLHSVLLRSSMRHFNHRKDDLVGLETIRQEGYAAKMVAPGAFFTADEKARLKRFKRRHFRTGGSAA